MVVSITISVMSCYIGEYSSRREEREKRRIVDDGDDDENRDQGHIYTLRYDTTSSQVLCYCEQC